MPAAAAATTTALFSVSYTRTSLHPLSKKLLQQDNQASETEAHDLSNEESERTLNSAICLTQ